MVEKTITGIAGAFFTINETIGLYHYGLGERTIEIIVNDIRDELRKKPYWWEDIPRELNKRVKEKDIAKAIERYNPSLIFFNGMDPLSNKELVSTIKSIKNSFPSIHVGSSISCITNNNTMYGKEDVLSIIDYAIVFIPDFNDLPELLRKPSVYELCVTKVLKTVHAEMHVYVSNKDIKFLLGFLDNIMINDVPVHIYDYSTGGSRIIIEKLKSDGITNIYLHKTGGLGIEFTRCFSCKNIVLTRRKGFPTKNVLKGNKCGFCGAPVLFRAPRKNWTNMKILFGKREVIPWLAY